MAGQLKRLGLLSGHLRQVQSYPICEACRRAFGHGRSISLQDWNEPSKDRSIYTENTNEEARHLLSTDDEKTLTVFHKFDQELGKKLGKIKPLSIPTKSDSLADYMNSSKILQTLVMFGVKLFQIERQFPDAQDFLVKLDLNRDVVPKLHFLTKHGLTPKEFGDTITKNPHILNPKYRVEDFEEIIEYLKSKNFSQEQISSLLTRFSLFLNISVAKLDGILGFFQKLPTNYGNKFIYFGGNELRSLIIRCPTLITADLESVFMQIKLLELSFNFTVPQMKQIIVGSPSILFEDMKTLERRCRFFMTEMNLNQEEIAQSGFAFNVRLSKLERRHNYLKSLGRNKYKPDEKGYISLQDIVIGTDEEFCRKCNLGTLQDYETFLKTI